MKVLFASSVEPSLTSGVGNVEWNLIEGLKKKGVQVDGYYPKMRSMALTDFVKGFDLQKKAVEYEAVHAHTDISWRTNGAIRTFHGVAALGEHYYHAEPGRRLMPKHKQIAYFTIHKTLERACAKNNYCVGVSEYVGKALVKYYGADPKNVTTVYNGIDAKNYHPDKTAGKAFRKKYGIGQDKFLLTWVGHAEFNKGIHYLIESMNQIAEAKGAGDVAFAVRSPLSKQEFLKRGLTPKAVEKLHTVGVEPSLAGLYNACDAHLLTSVYEPFCLTLLEAMACQKPVVATESGGHAEIITEKEGFITPNKDAKAFGEAVMVLKRDEKLRSTMGIAARKLILNGFTKEHMVANMLKVYESRLKR